MATATVANPTTPHKAPRAYYALLYDRHGALTQLPDGAIYFLDDETDEQTVIEIEMWPFLTTLGEIGLCEAQAVVDKVRGGFARIACFRNN